jgi:hypothetical protein
MEWKWSDLEVGDKIKFTSDAIEINRNPFSRWSDFWADKTLEVEQIFVMDGKIKIKVKSPDIIQPWDRFFSIYPDGTSCLAIGKMTFEVVGLKED